jgi:hypothetical protein
LVLVCQDYQNTCRRTSGKDGTERRVIYATSIWVCQRRSWILLTSTSLWEIQKKSNTIYVVIKNPFNHFIPTYGLSLYLYMRFIYFENLINELAQYRHKTQINDRAKQNNRSVFSSRLTTTSTRAHTICTGTPR